MAENSIISGAKRLTRSVALLPVRWARFKEFFVLHRQFMEADKRLRTVNAQITPLTLNQARNMTLQNAKIALLVRDLLEHPEDPSLRESIRLEFEEFECIVGEFEKRLRPLEESADAIRREIAEIEHRQQKLEALESIESFV